MNFYQHYKNKPYRVLHVAKHSETLEEHVVYESLYDNPEGRLWVRPRRMFDEDVTVDGQTKPRFRKVAPRISTHAVITSSEESILAAMITEILGSWKATSFHAKVNGRARIHLQIAYVDQEPVGFKLGYQLDQHTFYSWLGGVRPSFRGLGIAGDLMSEQHAWCLGNGYRVVRTKSQNHWRAQMILNLRHGFEITGVEPSGDRGAKILLEKTL